MDKLKALFYIKNSFLASLLDDEDVTDISYNGKDIYYVSNREGRKKSDIIIEHQIAKDFIRQVANIAEKQFSFTSPVLDISVGRYRINATHQSIGRIDDEGVITFSIRIGSEEIRIDPTSDFFSEGIVHLVREIINSRNSIVIGGLTSSGKTEFQKFLIMNMKENERVIVIDNVMELDRVRNDYLDLTCWQIDENNTYATTSFLIKNALRNNPDWLILAEARSKEMQDVLTSAMTGLPIITTIHSKDAESLPNRMGRMVMQNGDNLIYEEVLNDIYYHFHFYIYLTKEEKERKVMRYISEINYVNNKGETYHLFKRDGDKKTYFPFTKEIAEELRIKKGNKLENTRFISGIINE